MSCPTYDGMLGRTSVGIQVSCRLVWMSLQFFTNAEDPLNPQDKCFKTLPWMPTTTGSTEPCLHYVFPTHKPSHLKEALPGFSVAHLIANIN